MDKKEAIKIVREYYPSSGKDLNEALETLIPELKNEDERIRIFLHKTFTEQYLAKDKLGKWHGEPVVNILTYLEKKGESKLIGKLQLSEELYEHIRNTCACIDDAMSSETLVDVKDYLEQASKSAQEAFDIVEKQGEQKPHNICDTCEDRYSYVNPCPVKLVGQKPAEINNICEFSIETWIKIVDYVLTEHNGIGNYLTDPEVKDTAEKLQKKYKFDAASEEWDRVYRKGLDAGVNKGRAEALREQNHTWSEEDKEALRVVTNIFEQHGIKLSHYPAFVHWLKILPNRITLNPYWKPSDEQMKAFYKYLNEGDKTLALSECLLLRQLYNDLKKLK